MAKKTTPTKEATKEKEVPKVAFITALNLKEYFGKIKCTVNTPDDIKRIAERQGIFDEVQKAYSTKVMETPVPEGATEEQIISLRTGTANDILHTPSSLNKEDLEFYTAEELIYGIKDLGLSNQEIGFLSFWLVKAPADAS